MTRILIAFCLISVLAACDQRQPSNPPGTRVGTGTQTSPDGGAPQPAQGGIPAGQANPQKPTDAGDSQQPSRQ
jgi:hypothetical protein